ncbi:ferredoxin [Catenuloplanes nepalensis]|uniref:Ferredoxin n=1 Tax=Catenuloplanes nepalensis TaxID=587533 RepID=A0ABT9MNZ7_9ACTN|nr:ferredoxin [Catenuloplanes nepalensis]MDP9793008.1 ferredoxin [Catenuloplanes nepalensis]
MTIHIDRERCVAAGTCVMTAPAVFDQDDDGIVELLQAEPADDAGVADAVARCPAAAIEVTV